jgi:hypothetical protein
MKFDENPSLVQGDAMGAEKKELKRGEKMDEEKARKLRAYKLFIKA